MQRSLIFFYCLNLSLLCSAQLPSENNISEVLNNSYREDAYRLALQYLSSDEPLIDISAEVPEDLVNSIQQALLSIHDSDIEEAIEVTRIRKVHSFPSPDLYSFNIVLEKDLAWANPIFKGKEFTDHALANQLIENYNLKVERFGREEFYDTVAFTTSKPYNISSLAKVFSLLEGVALVDIPAPTGDGNDLRIRSTNNGWLITYAMRFDSCTSGCLKYYEWTFLVQENDVTLVDKGGDELPN